MTMAHLRDATGKPIRSGNSDGFLSYSTEAQTRNREMRAGKTERDRLAREKRLKNRARRTPQQQLAALDFRLGAG